MKEDMPEMNWDRKKKKKIYIYLIVREIKKEEIVKDREHGTLLTICRNVLLWIWKELIKILFRILDNFRLSLKRTTI
jgi:hypothetical protein